MADNHISYRGTKKYPFIKERFKSLSIQKDRSVNFLIEQALLEFLIRNKAVTLTEILKPVSDDLKKQFIKKKSK